MNSPSNSATWSLERLPSERAYEVVAFHYPLNDILAATWPSRPGAVRRDANGQAVVLHIAPGRWLVHAADAATRDLIQAACRSGAVSATDVTGKWQSFALNGPRASRVLASTIDIQALQAERDCAAAVLFDCPAIVTWSMGRYLISVRSSHVASFLSAIHASAQSV